MEYLLTSAIPLMLEPNVYVYKLAHGTEVMKLKCLLLLISQPAMHEGLSMPIY